MRGIGEFTAVTALVLTGALAHAETAARADSAFAPYSKHYDTRFGHNRFYPDRGVIVREAPKGAIVVSYAGLAFRFDDGVWYEPRGPAFMVVAPPIGLLVPSLPTFATLLARGGQTYIYCNDTYYRPRPDLNGYEVANDPAEATFKVASEAGTGGPADIVAGGGNGAGVSAAGAASAPVAGASASTPLAITTPLDESAKVSTSTPVAPGVPPMTAAMPAAPASDAGAASASAPPPVVAAPPAAPAPMVASTDPSAGQTQGIKVALLPRNGQSSEQQARDRYECYRFAVAQTGFDPMRVGSGGSSGDYARAQSACFEGKGYTVH